VVELTVGCHLPMDCASGLSRRHQNKLDIVLSSRHECVYDDDRLIESIVDPDESTSPRRSVYIDRQPLSQCISDDGVVLSGHRR